ncbi:MAG: OmpA family protein [Elusimicrobia bacterium]|nr:OmpA family protein [Elusimicrobiota bacterium]
MRRLLLVGLAAGACACGGPRQAVLVDNDLRRFPRLSDSAAQRQAQEALRAVQEKVDRGELPQIRFEFDKDAILPESYPTLDQIALILRSDDRLKLFIRAHADAVGTDAYNLDLSERRAKSVKTYLAKRGVPPPTMFFKGFGESAPIADNETDAGRAKNRRVEFRVTTRDWNSVY